MHTQCDIRQQRGPQSGLQLIVHSLSVVTTAEGSSVIVGSPFIASGSLLFVQDRDPNMRNLKNTYSYHNDVQHAHRLH